MTVKKKKISKGERHERKKNKYERKLWAAQDKAKYKRDGKKMIRVSSYMRKGKRVKAHLKRV